MQQNRHKSTYARDLIWLTLGLGILFFIALGSRALFVPDEGRYAEIAREIVASKDWITPHLNGIKYFEKPPLFYWLAAGAFKLGGLNLWAIRLINASLGLSLCLITYLSVRRLFDRDTALVSAWILGTMNVYLVMSRMISLDLTVTFFLSVCLYSFMLGVNAKRSANKYFLLAALSAALAVLTKGLIGIVLPALIISLWIVIENAWLELKKIPWLMAISLLLLVAVPWHVLVGMRNPEFYYFYFVEQHFLRYTMPGIGHYQPAWFFIPVILLGTLPWACFLPSALRYFIQEGRRRRKDVFLALWAGLIFAFFSYSKSKLIPYILPVLPPLAILIARPLALFQQTSADKLLKASYALLAVIGIALSAFAFINHPLQDLPNAATLDVILKLIGCSFIVFGSSAYWFSFKKQRRAFYATLGLAWSFCLLLIFALPLLDTRTIRPLANAILQQQHPRHRVVTFNQYYQDLPFYLQKQITIVNWQNELTFGMQHQQTQSWMWSDIVFWQHWRHENMFVVMSKDELKKYSAKLSRLHKWHVIASTYNDVLITNIR